MRSASYRGDIDGLRAVAVLSVVLFHAGIGAFSGGYVGVDVFFVISGYLITGGIASEVAEGEFSLGGFYERRARRIVPALAVILLASLVASALWLLPEELAPYGRSLAAAATSWSNFLFWSEDGYFAAPSDGKPLLHTWSLAVEEQFYVFLPLVLWLLLRWSKRLALVGCLALTLGSLALSIHEVERNPSTAFYLLSTRAWELMFGGLLSLGALPAPRPRALREALAATGLLMMGFSVFSYTESTRFPGLSAALPCVGAAAVIHAGSAGETWLGRTLGSRVPRGIGLVSYSLYLWHWPVLMFTRLQLFRPPGPWEMCLALAVCGLLSVLSWRFVEQPFRQRGWLTRRAVLAWSGASLALLSGVGALLWYQKGFPERVPPEVRALLAISQSNACPEVSLRTFGKHGPSVLAKGDEATTTLLWGDSHAGPLGYALKVSARRAHVRLLSAWNTGCVPLPGVDRVEKPNFQCVPKNNAVASWVAKSNVKHVILASRWALFAEGTHLPNEPGAPVRLRDLMQPNGPELPPRQVLRAAFERTITWLQSRGIRVTVIASTPEVGIHVPRALARLMWWHQTRDLRPTVAQFMERQRFAFELLETSRKQHGIEVVYPHLALCGAQYCSIEDQGRPLYYDDDHLSIFGAQRVVPIMDQVFASPISASGN